MSDPCASGTCFTSPRQLGQLVSHSGPDSGTITHNVGEVTVKDVACWATNSTGRWSDAASTTLTQQKGGSNTQLWLSLFEPGMCDENDRRVPWVQTMLSVRSRTVCILEVNSRPP